MKFLQILSDLMYTYGMMYSKFLLLLLLISRFSMAKSIVKFLLRDSGTKFPHVSDAISNQGHKRVLQTQKSFSSWVLNCLCVSNGEVRGGKKKKSQYLAPGYKGLP